MSYTFGGKTFDEERDEERLRTQLTCVKEIMADRKWRTLSSIQAALLVQYGKKGSEAGISARLRDLKKPQFGSHKMEKRRVNGSGYWEYRMELRTDEAGQLGRDPSWTAAKRNYTGAD